MKGNWKTGKDEREEENETRSWEEKRGEEREGGIFEVAPSAAHRATGQGRVFEGEEQMPGSRPY